MYYILAFLAGAIATSVVSDSTRRNARTVNNEFQNLLDNRRELSQRVDDLLRQKEQSGEIEINKKI